MGLLSRLFRKSTPPDKPSAQADHRSAGWPFDQSPNTAAIATRQVLDGEKEIRVVVHYSDDHSWAFLCGTTDDPKDGCVTLMGEAVRIDETVKSIADLPPGWKAVRERRGEPWVRAQNFEQG